MNYVEQRMNNYGNIRLRINKEHAGVPVAFNMMDSSIVCIKNQGKELQTFLGQDGLTKKEVNKWMEKKRVDDPDRYAEFFQTFSRSLEYGISFVNHNRSAQEKVNTLYEGLEVENKIKNKKSSDFLFSYKFSVKYKIKNSYGKTSSEEEEFYLHLLISNKPRYKVFEISFSMTPPSFKTGDSIPFQIVFANNPKLISSLSKNSGFAYSLDAVEQQKEIKQISTNHFAYQIWNKPKMALIANRELPNWFFPIAVHLSSYKNTIVSGAQEYFNSVEPISSLDENDSDTLQECFKSIQNVVLFYLDMQNFRLPEN
jgi:hypothetical protein